MAEFNGFILTNKGRELLAKAIAGETLTFTKISFGDGLYEGDKKEIQELESEFQLINKRSMK